MILVGDTCREFHNDTIGKSRSAIGKVRSGENRIYGAGAFLKQYNLNIGCFFCLKVLLF